MQKKTIVEILVLLVVGTIAAVVFVPAILYHHGSGNEAGAVATLKCIATGQEQFRAAVCVDLNRNEVGEYGFLEELAGTARVRTLDSTGARVVLEGQQYEASPFLPHVLGETPRLRGEAGNYSTKSGYHVAVHLPVDACRMTDACGEATDAGLCEHVFVAYVWPVRGGDTGVRAFMVGADGEVYAANNLLGGSSYSSFWYSGTSAPPFFAGLAMNPRGGFLFGSKEDPGVWIAADSPAFATGMTWVPTG